MFNLGRDARARDSRERGAELGQALERGEPDAALVPVARGERHLALLRRGEIVRVERLRERLELADDGVRDFAGGEFPEEDAEALGAVFHLFALGGLIGGRRDARIVKRA